MSYYVVITKRVKENLGRDFGRTEDKGVVFKGITSSKGSVCSKVFEVLSNSISYNEVEFDDGIVTTLPMSLGRYTECVKKSLTEFIERRVSLVTSEFDVSCIDLATEDLHTYTVTVSRVQEF